MPVETVPPEESPEADAAKPVETVPPEESPEADAAMPVETVPPEESPEADAAKPVETVPPETETEERPPITSPVKKKELRSEEQEITKKDLEKLTTLEAGSKQITSIAGLEYAINLEHVNLDGNEIADISPLGKLEKLKSFSANAQTIKLEEKPAKESKLTIPNPLKGLDIQTLTEISGEGVQTEGDTITFGILKGGANEREASFIKQYEKGSFSGKLMQKVTVVLAGAEKAGEIIKQEVAPRGGERQIYYKKYRFNHIQSAHGDVFWNPTTKKLRMASRASNSHNGGSKNIYVALADETEKNAPGNHYYRPYTRAFKKLFSNGFFEITGDAMHKQNYTFQASTGSLLYAIPSTTNDIDNAWNASLRYDDKMGIAYTDPQALGKKTDHFKILADGSMRREEAPNFLASEMVIPYLNTTFKVHENHMAVLGDDFLTTGNGNKKVMIRLKKASGEVLFEGLTQEEQRHYDRFKDIQGFRFDGGEILEITDFTGKKSTTYRYNWSMKQFQIIENDTPLKDRYLIQLIGNKATEEEGYDLFIDNGKIETVYTKSVGKILHPYWGNQVYLSIGIFRANGDLKKAAMIQGATHEVSDTSDVSFLKGTSLEDGDEIVLYGSKRGTWDESSKIRVLGKVNGGMNGLDTFNKKPDFNTTVFRYSSATGELSQVDGTIADMTSELKSIIEVRMSEHGVDLGENGDKKACLQGMYYGSSNGEIRLGNPNIQKLTGLEYAINLDRLSLSMSKVKCEPDNTYRSLRNLRKLVALRVEDVGLKGYEKMLVDVLVDLPELKELYANTNKITDVKEFARLCHLIRLDLNRNSISDISPLKVLEKTGLKSLSVYEQTIVEPKVDVGTTEEYSFTNPIKSLDGNPLKNIQNIRPRRKGEYFPTENRVTWSNLGVDTWELSFEFIDNKQYEPGEGVKYLFGGKVNIPVDVFDTNRYNLEIDAGYGGAVNYTVGSESGTVTSTDTTGVMKTFNVFEGQSVSVEAVPKPGFRFVSWEDGSTLAKRTFNMPAGEMTLRARFERIVVISFNPNGGKWVSASPEDSTTNKKLILNKGETLESIMNDPEFAMSHPSGYRFAGWYQNDKSEGEAWNLTAPILNDMALYAGWEYDNEAIALVEIPRGIDLENNGSGELIGTGTVKIVDDIDQNLKYKNMAVKATPTIQLTNPNTTDFYDVRVWKADGSQYTDGNQPLMYLHPKGVVYPQQATFTLKAPNTSPKKQERYTGNMIFQFSWE